jgi:hypothetical protein
MSHSSGYKFDKVVFKTPREQINALVTEMSELKDEVEYHKADAKKWALQALKFDKWEPIDTAPKDGRYLMVGNEDGVWVACFTPTFQSGFQPGNPWISLMLNHRHIEKVKRNYSSVPTHWMPLPAPPKVGAGKTGEGS